MSDHMDSHENNLQAAYDKAAVTMNKKPTTDNIKAYQAARKALDDYKAEMKAKANPEARRFANILEVFGYLTDEGWKVSKSKLYEDANKIGKESDGTFTKKNVDEYARLCLTKTDGSDVKDPDGLKKAQIENEIAAEKLKKIQRENEIESGLWVLKSEVEQKHTAKLALFLTAVDNFIHGGKLEQAVDLVGGNREKAAEFKALIKKEFREILGEYAKKPAFTVPVKTMAEAEEMIKEAEE